MDFKEMTYVLAIARHQSITKAANSLYLSQPTLTKFLQQLEASLGLRLFDRVGKRLVLTHAGERYVARATEIFAIKTDLDQELQDIAQGRTGTLRIGFSSVRGREIILNVLPGFLKIHPKVLLKFREVDTSSFEAPLLAGDLDLAFFNLPIQSPNIDYQVVAYDEVILVARQDHPLTRLAQERPGCLYPWIDLSLTREEVFILPSAELRLSAIVSRLFDIAGFFPNVSFYSKSIESSCILAAEGYGLTLAGEQHIIHTKFDRAPAVFSVGDPCTRRTFVAAYRRGPTCRSTPRTLSARCRPSLAKSGTTSPPTRPGERIGRGLQNPKSSPGPLAFSSKLCYHICQISKNAANKRVTRTTPRPERSRRRL